MPRNFSFETERARTQVVASLMRGSYSKNKVKVQKRHEYTGEAKQEDYGWTFLYAVLVSGDVHVHMPHRVVDSALGRVLKRYRSFRCYGTVKPVRNAEARRDPRNAIQDFLLSATDWAKFLEVVEKSDWKIVDDSITQDLIDLSLSSLYKRVTVVESCLSHSMSLPGTVNSESELSTALGLFEKAQTEQRKFMEDSKYLLSLMNKALSQERDLAERVQIERELEKVATLRLRIGAANLDKSLKQAVAIYRAATGESDKKGIAWIKSLEEELAMLKAYYPVLSYLKVVGDELEVVVATTKIRLSPGKGVRILGGLEGLIPFTKEYLKEGAKVSRFSAIDLGEDK